jgi:hypothetical protein
LQVAQETCAFGRGACQNVKSLRSLIFSRTIAPIRRQGEQRYGRSRHSRLHGCPRNPGFIRTRNSPLAYRFHDRHVDPRSRQTKPAREQQIPHEQMKGQPDGRAVSRVDWLCRLGVRTGHACQAPCSPIKAVCRTHVAVTVGVGRLGHQARGRGPGAGPAIRARDLEGAAASGCTSLE